MRRFLSPILVVLLLVQPAAAIRVPSGSTTHKKFFRMVDATDHVTPETGLSSFTVYRSREGGTNTVWTTPTIAEIDATNSPGLYVLTLDEDTTITTANDTEEMAISVAHAGCDTEIFIVELYDDTGSNMTSQPWNAAWDAEVESEANDALVAEHLDHLLAATYDVTAQPGSATSLLNRIVESDSGNPIFTTQVLQQAPVISQAAVRTAVGLAAANLDTQLATAQADLDTITGTNGVTLATAQANYAPATTAGLATAQADLDILTGTNGVTLATSQPNYAAATAAALATAQADLDTLTGSDGVTLATSQPNYAPATAAALATTDAVADAVKVVTDKIDTALEADGASGYQFTALGLENAPGTSGTVDANLIQVNGTSVAGTGSQVADTWLQFYNVVGTKTVNDVGVAGSGLTKADVRSALFEDTYSFAGVSEDSALGQIIDKADDASFTYDRTTDSLEAIKDNTAWNTATGFATAAALATAQTDLDTITGSDGVTLATTQSNYVPATAAALATADSVIDAALVILNKLDTGLEADGSSGYQFTTLALENGPSGGGGGGDATLANQTTLLANLATVDTVVDSIKVITDELDGMITAGVYSAEALANAPTASGASTQPRQNKPAGPSFRLTVSRRADGTHKCTRPIRLRAGAVGGAGTIAVSINVAPIFGSIYVETVGTPTVSSGSITAAALGPRDEGDQRLAMVALDGTATAEEQVTVTVPITMETNESINVTFDVIVFAD